MKFWFRLRDASIQEEMVCCVCVLKWIWYSVLTMHYDWPSWSVGLLM